MGNWACSILGIFVSGRKQNTAGSIFALFINSINIPSLLFSKGPCVCSHYLITSERSDFLDIVLKIRKLKMNK